ncbi:hypothetical protein [Roseomonas sp. BN140053]|uniref:hypothetical protein n=1 Tax=Roseomonas sp. BN140053 TaxID=3391898 RepID=UPI0039E7FEB7
MSELHYPDGLTRITTRGPRLCKTIHADGTTEGYGLAKHVDLVPVLAPDRATLLLLLSELRGRERQGLLRGAIAQPWHRHNVRRLMHRDPETGDEPTILDVPRSWVALDCDGIPAPAGTDPRDLAECGTIARGMLPAAFHAAACVVQATASHGIKPGLRLRLWFHLERPLIGAMCQRWLRDVPGLDRSTLRAAQVCYTAAPVFVGMADPLPTRLAELPGEERVPCPAPEQLMPPPRPEPNPAALTRGAGGGDRYAWAALTRACTNIATAPVDSRHPTAVSEAWSLARLVVAGLLTGDEVVRAVDGALQQAGKPAGEGSAIAAWAVAQRTDSGAASKGSR